MTHPINFVDDHIMRMTKVMLYAKQKHIKKCEANQKQQCKQVGATQISVETKKLLYQNP